MARVCDSTVMSGGVLRAGNEGWGEMVVGLVPGLVGLLGLGWRWVGLLGCCGFSFLSYFDICQV